ncbi:MAG TPA: PEGA domain-containing protein [Bryobacteraceae bacterium]
MKRYSHLAKLLIGLGCCACLAAAGDDAVAGPKSKTRVRLAGISVGAGYFRGPAFWPYYPAYWGMYGMYDPFFYPGFYNGFARGYNMGEVKLRVEPERAEVFLDGAYAGAASERKSMWLEPGAYLLEVKAAGRDAFSRKIYVLSGKSLKIDAALEPAHTENQP